MSDLDRPRWLEPSPPLPVDGEEPGPKRSRVLPEDAASAPEDAQDEPARDPEDETPA